MEPKNKYLALLSFGVLKKRPAQNKKASDNIIEIAK
jgi:hypothetical protein